MTKMGEGCLLSITIETEPATTGHVSNL